MGKRTNSSKRRATNSVKPAADVASETADDGNSRRADRAKQRALERYRRGLTSGESTVPIPSYAHEAFAIEAVVAVARKDAKVALEPAALEPINRARAVVERCLKDGQAHYGINTGFGSLAKQRIDADDLRTLQRNLVRSHNAGVGEPLARETVRGMMLLLAASLARGLSGVRPIVVQTLVEMLNKGVTPVVPSIGSVGASGDLAPLAAIACVLIGEGKAWVGEEEARRHEGTKARSGNQRARCASEWIASQPLPGHEALKQAGIKPITLEAKEGLALINGTHLMAAEGAMLHADSNVVLDAANLALAFSIDACRASHSFLDDRLYNARWHMHVSRVVHSVGALLQGSTIRNSHLKDDSRVQDPYSLRAGPTVHGAVAATVHPRHAIWTELKSITDNPLVFPKGWVRSLTFNTPSPTDAILSGANFHGMPIALPLDYLAIALCHLAGISERRVYLLTGAAEPEMRQKPYLIPSGRKAGLQSGLMIAQYTAAACVNEMIGLATPASVANIPTCAGMEDYNSFGPRSAAKARRAVELCRKVIAIELLCAAQGLESHRPLRSGRGVEKAYRIIRKHVPKITDDRPLTDDIEAIARLIAEGAFSI